MLFGCINLGVIILDEKEMNGEQASVQELDELLNADLDDILSEWLKEDVSVEETGQPVIEQKEKNPEETKKQESGGWQKTILMYLHDLVYLLAGLILVFLLLFRVVVVSGTSMNNTLLDGDYEH